MELDIATTVSDEYLLTRPVSSHHSVGERRTVKLPSTIRDTFTYSGNRLITFHVASNHHFLHPDTRLAFDYQYTGNNVSASNLLPVAFDVGGAQCLFKSIRVVLRGTGTEIPLLDDYNRMFALYSNMFQTDQEVLTKAYPYFDDLKDYPVMKTMKGGSPYLIDDTVFYTQLIEATGGENFILMAADCDPANLVAVGDIIYFRISSIANNPTAPVVSVGEIYSAVILTTEGTERYKISESLQFCSTNGEDIQIKLIAVVGPGQGHPEHSMRALANRRTNVGSGNSTTAVTVHVEMPLMYSFLKHTIPLFLLRNGFDLHLELADPQEALMGAACIPNVSYVHDYAITNPELMMVISKPHRNVQDEYLQRMQSPNGLVYYIPGVDHWRYVSTNNQNDTIQLNLGRRSVRKMYFIFQSSSMERGDSAITSINPSLSHTFRSKIDKFQVELGGERYPHYEIDIQDINGDVYGMEAFNYLMECNRTDFFNNEVKSPHDARASYRNTWPKTRRQVYWEDDTQKYVTNESEFFCIGVNVSRDIHSNGVLTGVDLQGVTATIRIERSGTVGGGGAGEYPGNTVMHVFSCYDAMLSIGVDKATVMA